MAKQLVPAQEQQANRARSAKQPGSKEKSSSSPTGTFDDLVGKYPSPAREIAWRLREIVYEELPDAEETVWTGGWRLALYKDGSEICGIGPVKDYINFYLTRGAEIPDAEKLLEGRGKGIRHVKVRTPEGLPEEAIRGFIREGRRLVQGGRRLAQ